MKPAYALAFNALAFLMLAGSALWAHTPLGGPTVHARGHAAAAPTQAMGSRVQINWGEGLEADLSKERGAVR